MDDVARLSATDRRDLFTTVAARRGNLSPAIVEKDFWVCWTLRRVFALEPWASALIFKGGTSLSKAYDVISRFSEDVDLSFRRSELGFSGETDPANAPSRKKAQLGIKQLAEECRALVRETLLPNLQTAIREALGETGDEEWRVRLDGEDPDQQTLLFEYPAESAQDSRYVPPMVRLEFGARSDHWPAEERAVMSYASETLPDTFKDASTVVRVLAPERTFWEKVTILHSWCHAPATKRGADRQSRHYYDVVMLYRSEFGLRAMNRLDLLEAVATHKNVFFPAAWARYDTARPGSLRLLPSAERRREMEKDYGKMAEMFFDEPPTFGEICDVLGEIETAVNGAR